MEQKIWWYAVNNEQKGPVSQEELNVLSSQNFINPATLVWKQGLPNWIKISEMNAPVDNDPPSPPRPPAFSQPIVSQPQPVPGYAQQHAAYPQQGSAYAQPNIAQPQAAFNFHAGTSSSNGMTITDNYYRAEFEKIISSNESYKGKWNWWAFFFNWVWCFTKGLWQYAVLVLAGILVLSYFLPLVVSNIFSLAIAIFFGSRGTWFYYNLKMKNKQLF